LKDFFAIIIIFEKKFDEHFENSTRHKTKTITVLNMKENYVYPEAKHGHGLSSLETTLRNTLPHETLSKNMEEILVA
jgi:hypothetical protein